MRYQFPEIRHIDDVRPAIEGRDEFIIAERGPFNIVCYVVAMVDTFPPVNTVNDAIRRECRGMIFCSDTGRILRRPFGKFFNINEKDETQLSQLDFNLQHIVYTKLDGSMISPFEVGYKSGIIRWGTKMGPDTSVALQAESFVSMNPKYQDFAKWCISNDLTPIFEYTAPDNRIVIRYDKPSMTLLAVRHMITGKYLNLF